MRVQFLSLCMGYVRVSKDHQKDYQVYILLFVKYLLQIVIRASWSWSVSLFNSPFLGHYVPAARPAKIRLKSTSNSRLTSQCIASRHEIEFVMQAISCNRMKHVVNCGKQQRATWLKLAFRKHLD